MIEYRIAIAPIRKFPNLVPKHKLFRNRNPPKQSIQKQNPKSKEAPLLQFKKPNINRQYPSRNQIATVKNKTKIIRNKVIQLFIFVGY